MVKSGQSIAPCSWGKIPGGKYIIWGLLVFYAIRAVVSMLDGVFYLFFMSDIFERKFIVTISDILYLISVFVGLGLFYRGLQILKEKKLLLAGNKKLRLGVLLGLLDVVCYVLWRGVSTVFKIELTTFLCVSLLLSILGLIMCIYWLKGYREIKVSACLDEVGKRNVGVLQWMVRLTFTFYTIGYIRSIFVVMNTLHQGNTFLVQVVIYFFIINFLIRVGYILIGIFSVRSWKAILLNLYAEDRKEMES